MSSSIRDYRQLVEQPWGRMFYDMIYRQLNTGNKESLNILDFGAGFCVTADYYAENHKVTVVEPNQEMLDLRVQNHEYRCILGGLERLEDFEDCSFDLIICHNVLEYVSDQTAVLKQLTRILKPGKKLSVVKHNITGRILATAVLNDNPKAALELLNDGQREDNMFGSRNTYSNESLIDYADVLGLSMEKISGIRTFFGLSSNNEIKFTDEWYSHMLELEMKVCDIEQYKNIACFNHLVFTKR